MKCPSPDCDGKTGVTRSGAGFAPLPEVLRERRCDVCGRGLLTRETILIVRQPGEALPSHDLQETDS